MRSDKYEPLKWFLSGSGKETIQMRFSEIEHVIGCPLPKSARMYPAWWANGGHIQADAWLNAGYKAAQVSLTGQTVCFSKCGAAQTGKPIAHIVPQKTESAGSFNGANAKTMQVCGYEFAFLQVLKPDCDAAGKIRKYYPQNDYDNASGLPLSKYGQGAFCRFAIRAEDWPGVYLWVVDGRIIYIGETANLRQRFNMGYGTIHPRNCFIGGQNTNCKMNKVVLDYSERGKSIRLFFHQTADYKQVELELLRRVNTPYNVKDNSEARNTSRNGPSQIKTKCNVRKQQE